MLYNSLVSDRLATTPNNPWTWEVFRKIFAYYCSQRSDLSRGYWVEPTRHLKVQMIILLHATACVSQSWVKALLAPLELTLETEGGCSKEIHHKNGWHTFQDSFLVQTIDRQNITETTVSSGWFAITFQTLWVKYKLMDHSGSLDTLKGNDL